MKQEFINALYSPLDGWGNKTKDEVRILLGNEAAEMVGFDQRNPHHCYDLFFHTLHTINHVRQQDGAPLLLTAAFFHDIAKPLVAFEKEGRLVFYGHAKKSAEVAEPILRKMGFTKEEIAEITFYIGHHDDFISYVLPTEDYDHTNPYLTPITPENVHRHMADVATAMPDADWDWDRVWHNLMTLAIADAKSQSVEVVMDGVVTDSMEHKLAKLYAVRDAMKD